MKETLSREAARELGVGVHESGESKTLCCSVAVKGHHDQDVSKRNHVIESLPAVSAGQSMNTMIRNRLASIQVWHWGSS